MKQIKDKIYCVDIDGVSLDFKTPFSSYLKHRLKIDYDDKDVVDYYWHKCDLGISEEDFNRLFLEFSSHSFRWLKPFRGSRYGINFLLKNAKDVWFVTGRPHSAYVQTVESLKENFGVNSDRIIISNRKDYKLNVIRRLGADVAIDDAPHCVEAMSNSPDTKVYLMDETYNRDISGNFTRVRNWEQFIAMEMMYENSNIAVG